jgi:protein-arginine kinase activator protein McsA
MRDSIESKRCKGCGVEYYLSPEEGVCVDCSVDSMEMLSPVLLRVMSNLVERATAAGCPPNEENAEMLRSHGINVPREGQEGE